MRSRSRRLRANLYYLQRPARQFVPLFVGAVALVLLGGVLFHVYYEQPLSFEHALYATYNMLFAEQTLPFPRQHWFLQLFYVLLPILGLVVVLDGVVRFSYHLLRRDDTGPEWVSAMAKTMKDHVILFGLGKLGLRVLQQLLRLEELVIVIEKDPLCPNIAFARRHGFPVRIATGREEGLLAELNLQQAKSLIMATDDDLANLEVAIDARKLKPDIRVVLRMFDQELATKIKDSMGLHLAFSTSELAAPLFATASADPSIESSFYVGEELMVVARLDVVSGSRLIGCTVGGLRDDAKSIVLELRRGGTAQFLPESGLALAAGDQIKIQTRAASLRGIHERNRGAQG